jgi:CBS domain-containing protein
MKVQEVMSTEVQACSPNDTLNRAAQIMWERDCGAVPVVDDDLRVVGMLTDRDVCMSAYTTGLPLSQIPVSTASAKAVYLCKASDSVQVAENVMRLAQVRRIPVVDDDGRLCGLLTLADLARHVHRCGRRADGLSYESVALTLAAVSHAPAEHGQIFAGDASQLKRTAGTAAA